MSFEIELLCNFETVKYGYNMCVGSYYGNLIFKKFLPRRVLEFFKLLFAYHQENVVYKI